jgi:NAD(P)-dependent dehydrogenase (short-subunit alcohol dehydrogenase family)
MSIVITGASGQLARMTAGLVLNRMPASEVILTTRRPEALSDLAERGARVRQADFDRPETLAEAFIQGLSASGMPEPAAREIASYGRAIREGYIDQVSHAVENLTGRRPRRLREVLEAERHELLQEVSA